MRTAVTVAFFVVLAGCGEGLHPAAVPAELTAAPLAAPTRAPGAGSGSWLPPLTGEQRAALASAPDGPVEQRASRTYPDLERFLHSHPRPFDEQRAVRAAHLLERAVSDSPKLYVVRPAHPGLANLAAQYGPPAPPEPEEWVRAVQQPGGHYRLVWALPGDAARRTVDSANQALADGDPARAARFLQQAVRHSPEVPALWLSLARVRRVLADDEGAMVAADRALELDPRSPSVHVHRAELLLRSGDLPAARAAAAHALALYPASASAWAVASRLVPLAPRPRPPQIFLEVTDTGAIYVGAPTDLPRTVYALCRAALRYEPGLRTRLVGIPEAEPYHLSVAEERVCLEAMLGAHLDPETLVMTAAVAQTRSDSDPEVGRLLQLARSGWLHAYVLFDIIGQHRPEWLRLAPDGAHQSVVAYVRRYVLASATSRDDPSPGFAH